MEDLDTSVAFDASNGGVEAVVIDKGADDTNGDVSDSGDWRYEDTFGNDNCTRLDTFDDENDDGGDDDGDAGSEGDGDRNKCDMDGFMTYDVAWDGFMKYDVAWEDTIDFSVMTADNERKLSIVGIVDDNEIVSVSTEDTKETFADIEDGDAVRTAEEPSK